MDDNMARPIALLAIALAAIPPLVVAQTGGIDIYQRHFSTLMGGGGFILRFGNCRSGNATVEYYSITPQIVKIY